MNSLTYLRGRRIWLAPDFVVWGASSSRTVSLATVESINGQLRISYSPITVGGAEQTVLFADLIDHRGNSLPSTITEAKVVVMPKSAGNVFIVGREFGTGFKIAREGTGSSSTVVDLIIMELG